MLFNKGDSIWMVVLRGVSLFMVAPMVMSHSTLYQSKVAHRAGHQIIKRYQSDSLKKHRISLKAPREPITELVSCCPCESNASDICVALREIRECCERVLATSCGQVIHIRQSDIPLTITQPGNYCIVEDLTTSSTAITIRASGVVVDVNNHSIVLTDIYASAFAVKDTSDITIFGGFIRAEDNNGEYGVYVADSARVFLHDMTFDHVRRGVFTKETRGIIVEKSNFSGNQRGIQFCPEDTLTEEQEEQEEFEEALCSECFALNCLLVNFTQFGVVTTNASNICLQDLTLRGTANSAQHVVLDKSVHAVVQNIKSEGFGTHGILANSCQEVTISNCSVLMEQEDALGIAVRAGFRVFIDGTLTEVEVDQAKNCVITDCFVSGFFNHGIHLEGCQKVVVNASYVLGDGVVGLFVKHTQDARINECAIDLEIGDSGVAIRNSSIVSLRDCAIALEAPASGSNAVDILNSASLTFDSCIINLNAPEDEQPSGDGILLRGGVRSCVIQNCSIINFPEVGILAIDSESFGPSYEIVVDGCVFHNALQDAICLEGVYAGSIKNCEISFADFNGINLIGCSEIALLNNVVQNCGEVGIRLDENTINCGVRDNSIFANLVRGMENSGGSSNAIYHNFAHSNGAGPADNYSGVALVVAPAPGVGVLENISQ